jgi:hypothetical protein
VRTVAATFLCALVLTGCPGRAARFTDSFSTLPSEQDRKPFVWDVFTAGPAHQPVWRIVDGALELNAQNLQASAASFTFETAGVTVSDATPWTAEVGFRHISGTAPRPEFEALFYVTWYAEAGGMRILAVLYDAANKTVILMNGGGKEPPAPADLTGGFHAVRMTAADGQVRLFVDGELKVGPIAMSALPYAQAPGVFIGPISGGEPLTLQYQFDYLAFTDAALAPGEGGWNPAADAEPVAERLKPVASVFALAPYPGITLLRREQGERLWQQAIPPQWRDLQALINTLPATVESPWHVYPGENAPSKQNMYRNYLALQYDENRWIRVSHSTRGIDDTDTGFLDYKMWYSLSSDGGRTWSQERPMVQAGDEFDPMHPCRYVWIGKNSFCYASVPPLLKLSNGQILMPFYYAPLDENGNYYNPKGAYTFTYVACMIGTWNEAGDDIIWDVSEDIRLDADLSSRGSNECAVIELRTPGHILMVTRGSNAPFTGTQKAWKWKTLSTDYGKTWSEYTQFTYDDGEGFLSPSSMSNFIRSSKTGKAYWIGNISRTQPSGNSPRYPLVIAELDEEKLALRRETVTILDDRGPADSPEVQFSNFQNIEDPQTGHILVRCERLGGNPGGVHTYEVEVR